MDLSFSPAQIALRDEVKAFVAETVTPEVLAATGGRCEAHVPEFYAELARRGWIGLQWPVEYGGQGRPPVDMTIFYEEMGFGRAPLGRYTGSVVFVGGSIIAYGSPEQQRTFLPRIAAGEMLCAWALTEPGAGSDAAAITTRAERDGDTFVLSGEKMFISGAHIASHLLAAVRSRPRGAHKHEGLSIFLVPTDSPGLTIRPVHTIAGFQINAVHFDDVALDAALLVGQEGNGWAHINTTLGLERSVGAALLVGVMMATLGDIHAWLQREAAAGRPVRHDSGRLAQAASRVRAARLATYRAAWLHESGSATHVDSSVVKLLVSEAALELADVGLELVGPQALRSAEANEFQGRLEYLYREVQFHVTAGGTNDIQRNILARMALGLPRG